MIKIIEKEKKFDGRCDMCGTTFEYDINELHTKNVEKSLLDGKEYSYIECPVCSLKVTNIWHNRPEIQPFLY